MEKFILRIFLSTLWDPVEKNVLRQKIEKHFQDKEIGVRFVSLAEDADIALFKSILERKSIEKSLPPFLPCIYLAKTPHENPPEWIPSYFRKIPQSIELIGLGIRKERMIFTKASS